MGAGQGGDEGLEQPGGDGLLLVGGLVLLITAGEAHLGVPVPHQPCPVGLHGAVVVGPAHVSQLLGPLVARLVGGVLGQVLLAVLLEKGSSG